MFGKLTHGRLVEVGGAVSAFSVMIPIVGEPLGHASLVIWTIIMLIIVVSFNILSRYKLIENVAFWMVVVFALVTVGLAFALPTTKFTFGFADIVSGFTFSIPAGTVGIADAAFGLIGVGADEMTTYTYWCMEKGSARMCCTRSQTCARRATT